MAGEFQVVGKSASAPFTLKIHRGEGMALLAMNWKNGKRPPDDFVGFGIQYREPNGSRYFDLKNRLGFLGANGKVDRTKLSTMLSPIQKFRWVHFPRNANMKGAFAYRVTPVFMNSLGELSYGLAQDAEIELYRETYPGKLNVSFTRGFVSSQAFVDRYESAGPVSTLLPKSAKQGLTFKPTHPKTKDALEWMGFEARAAILEVLDKAISKGARVDVAAYDLSEPEVVSRLEQIGDKLRIIIDDDGDHGEEGSGESQAEQRLIASAGPENVKRQHMGKLQHNKMIVVDGPGAKIAICGSTNFSWRGFYVQANNAVIVQGANPIKPFKAAFEAYWTGDGGVAAFGGSDAAEWTSLGMAAVDAEVTFSPHAAGNARLKDIAKDIGQVQSSLFYSLAFLAQTEGAIKAALNKATNAPNVFVYGMADKELGGFDLEKPDGNTAPVFPDALKEGVPLPFSAEPTGGGGIRLHHKFVVIDFDRPTARVYFGSYNFSETADRKNGENLLVVRDRKVATSYMVEALRLFDHYHFRVASNAAGEAGRSLSLKRPPASGEVAWFVEDYTVGYKIRDRELFS